LGEQILKGFRTGTVQLQVPQYDKSRYHGRGDRVGWTTWQLNNGHTATPNVLIFEGWLLGFKHLTPVELDQLTNHAPPTSMLHRHTRTSLQTVNQLLASYETAWYTHLDLFIHLDPQTLDDVYIWREQQEQALRVRTGSGMSPAQVKSFIDTFMVGYALWLPQLQQQGLIIAEHTSSRRIPTLRIVLDTNRSIVRTSEFI
jgi:D-glycerate 3-kinase